MSDISFTSDNIVLKYRVCGLMKKGDKVLIQKIMDNKFYCLPGGHVHMGEDSESAIKRELNEELSKKTKNHRLFAVVENFFDGKKGKYHELGFYFEAEFSENIETKDYTITENDNGVLKKLEYRFVTKQELKDIDFRPECIKQMIISDDLSFRHIIQKD